MIKYIPLESVKTGMVAADHIFAPDDNVPIVLQNTVLSARMIERFKRHGVTRVPVEADEHFWDILPPLPSVKPILDEKLRDEALSSIRRMFHAVSEGVTEDNMTTAYHVVKELDVVVDQLVDTLAAEAKALIHIADLKSYDEYTYHHSLSVAVLSIAIGHSMSLDDSALRTLGRCAIMHDIGKILVPLDIINKPARLNDFEFTIIKNHPKFGYDYLAKGNIGDEAFREVVLRHHEKLDGAGYPDGIKDHEVPLMSRIISIADVYDAVTSYRAYRAPMPPAEAIELIMSQAGVDFDFDIVKAFIKKLELYPVNTCVELSNHQRGIVTDNRNSMRPVLRMLDTDDTLDLMDRGSLDLVITRVLYGREALAAAL